jgi:hypothetical protein
MVERDKPAFLAVLNGIAAIKPNAKLTPESLDVWWAAMRDWSLTDFRAAASHLIRTAEFFPSPYHFEQLRKAGGQTAAEAWTVVIENVRRGAYRSGVTVGGRADRVVRAMGGYAVLGMSNPADTHYRERRFAELWEQLGEAEEVRAALPDLAASGRASAVQLEELQASIPQLLKPSR